VIPPIESTNTSGVVVIDGMDTWWPRYIGIPSSFAEPMRLTVEDCRITKIEGGPEAGSFRRFLEEMAGRLGESVYGFPALHCGVHPQARVNADQCPSASYRRLIGHGRSSNINVHIGAAPPVPDYPYWMNCAGNIEGATWRVGGAMLLDRGHMTALDEPEVKAAAARYPGRPGL
jgi:hypothetical protein